MGEILFCGKRFSQKKWVELVHTKKAEPFRAWLAMVGRVRIWMRCCTICSPSCVRRSGSAGGLLQDQAVSGKQSTEQKKGETIRFPTLNFEAFSISAILRILKLINASKTHFSINNSKSYYKMRKTLFFWFVQFHTVLEVYEPQTLV